MRRYLKKIKDISMIGAGELSGDKKYDKNAHMALNTGYKISLTDECKLYVDRALITLPDYGISLRYATEYACDNDQVTGIKPAFVIYDTEDAKYNNYLYIGYDKIVVVIFKCLHINGIYKTFDEIENARCVIEIEDEEI